VWISLQFVIDIVLDLGDLTSLHRNNLPFLAKFEIFWWNKFREFREFWQHQSSKSENYVNTKIVLKGNTWRNNVFETLFIKIHMCIEVRIVVNSGLLCIWNVLYLEELLLLGGKSSQSLPLAFLLENEAGKRDSCC
jgi:hypothetical protein